MSSEEKIVNDVQRYGWHVINVFEGEDSYEFSYTIGLYKTLGSPELFMSGIMGEVAHTILNNIADDISKGQFPQPGQTYPDILEGYDCYFDLVDKSKYDEYFGKAVWFYQGDDFPVLQCVWPNQSNNFPWETDMSFRQDVLFKHP